MLTLIITAVIGLLLQPSSASASTGLVTATAYIAKRTWAFAWSDS